jgi:hypothetical protein
MIMPAADIARIFSDFRAYPKLGERLQIADESYVVPALQWLLADFHPWYGSVLKAIRLPKWMSNRWDCDDFAAGYRWLAQVAHARNGKTDAGIAVAECWYWRAGIADRAHAINCAIVDDGRLVYIEPQGCRLLELTPVELATIHFVRF